MIVVSVPQLRALNGTMVVRLLLPVPKLHTFKEMMVVGLPAPLLLLIRLLSNLPTDTAMVP